MIRLFCARFVRTLPAVAAVLVALGISPAAAVPTATAVPASVSPAPLDTPRTAVDSAVAPSAPHDSTALQRAAGSLEAGGASAPPETVRASAETVAPVFLGGREVFRVRAGRDGLTTSQRATAIRERLTAAVADQQVSADSVRLFSTPQGVEVRLGGHFLWVITPGDVAGVSHAELVTIMAGLPGRLHDGVEKERALRRPVGVLISVLIALLVTLVAVLVARLLLFAARRWREWLQAKLPRHLGSIRVRNYEVWSQAQVTGAIAAVLGRVHLVLGALLLYAYLAYVFSLFPTTQAWSGQLLQFAGARLAGAGHSVLAAVPGLGVIAVIVTLCRWLIGLFDRFFDSIEAGSHRLESFHSELARPSKRLVRILLWLAAAIIAFPYIPGAQSKAFQGASLFVGVLLSLGSTGVVGNVIAGLVLTYSQSFRVGDRVKIGEQVGDVVSLGFFATKLHTIRNEEVTLPNGQVSSSAVVNYTRLAGNPGLILHTQVTIGYDVEWRTVHELLVSAARRVDGVEHDPAPWVFQRSLDDSYVAYELNCITHRSHPQLQMYSDLHAQIQDAFNRAGVEILSPSYHAVRDANAAVLPAEPSGPRPAPGGFRVREAEPPSA